MIADSARTSQPAVRSDTVPSLEFLLRRFDRAGLDRPTLRWAPTAADLPSPDLRRIRDRWTEAAPALRPGRLQGMVPRCGDVVFIDPCFRLVGYPRQDGSQIVAVGEGPDGAGATDVTDLPIEVDLLRALYSIAEACRTSVLVSMIRPTMRAPLLVDRLVLPMARFGLLVALAPRG